ncbi:MAG TPA: FGGY-family carbohydrate kinase [Acidimicrobiales bacterium]|nr:FGGY-family carbohydrate kinase [Acidimicrobiales bacterium]
MTVAVVAVDFGASSIRVCRVELGGGAPGLSVVHRYGHAPAADASEHLRWDWPRLVAEMEKGLAVALEAGPVASIGLDTWGVDYGLLDGRGELVAPPMSYRDHRTAGYESVADRLGGAEALYGVTGVQMQPFNTVFQVAAHDREELARARHLLMLPELLVHHLTGEVVGERTSAGTTGLVDIRTGEWSTALAEAVGLDPVVLPPILAAGSRVGSWQGVPVHLVGGHDTASAVVAMGAHPGAGSAFVSAGTWSIVGREQAEPDLSAAARVANFANEIGALGGVRLLKNLAGAWLIERCRPAWCDPPIADLIAAAAATVDGPERVLDVADPRFLNPDDMLAAVTTDLGLPGNAPPPVVVRGVVESQAAGTAAVLRQLGDVTDVHVFGGAQSALYRRLLAERTGLPVCAGPVEATALGNALVQGLALGVYDDLADARRHLADPRAVT